MWLVCLADMKYNNLFSMANKQTYLKVLSAAVVIYDLSVK